MKTTSIGNSFLFTTHMTGACVQVRFAVRITNNHNQLQSYGPSVTPTSPDDTRRPTPRPNSNVLYREDIRFMIVGSIQYCNSPQARSELPLSSLYYHEGSFLRNRRCSGAKRAPTSFAFMSIPGFFCSLIVLGLCERGHHSSGFSYRPAVAQPSSVRPVEH